MSEMLFTNDEEEINNYEYVFQNAVRLSNRKDFAITQSLQSLIMNRSYNRSKIKKGVF